MPVTTDSRAIMKSPDLPGPAPRRRRHFPSGVPRADSVIRPLFWWLSPRRRARLQLRQGGGCTAVTVTAAAAAAPAATPVSPKTPSPGPKARGPRSVPRRLGTGPQDRHRRNRAAAIGECRKCLPAGGTRIHACPRPPSLLRSAGVIRAPLLPPPRLAVGEGVSRGGD